MHLLQLQAGFPPDVTLRLASDQALLLEFGTANVDLRARSLRVRRLCTALSRTPIAHVLDAQPAYASVLFRYDACQLTPEALAAALRPLLERLDEIALPPPRTVEIPVCYGGVHGPDLASVARHCRLSEAQVVELHAGAQYEVFFLGFAPGFAYLGGLPPELATPRLGTPRQHVPAGSVGIAGNQTGVYPHATPGGWRLIGRTPVPLFTPTAQPPPRLQMGDLVRFVTINEAAFTSARAAGTPATGERQVAS